MHNAMIPMLLHHEHNLCRNGERILAGFIPCTRAYNVTVTYALPQYSTTHVLPMISWSMISMTRMKSQAILDFTTSAYLTHTRQPIYNTYTSEGAHQHYGCYVCANIAVVL